MKYTIVFFFIFLTSLCINAWCQSLPIGAMPMQYNSSFAGSAGKLRLGTSVLFNRRDDGISQNYHFNAHASYDSFLPQLRSGIGIKLSSYKRSSSIDLDSIEYHSDGKGAGISFVIAPKLSIKGKYTFSPSLDIGINSTFSDYFENDPNWTPDPDIKTGLYYRFNSSFGLLFNTDQYYIGYSVNLFSGEFGEIELNSFYSNLQFGYTFQRNEQSKFSFTPQFQFVIRSKNEFYKAVSKPSYNLGLRYGQLLASIISSYEFKPTGFQIGWQNNGWRIVTIHEFSIYKFSIQQYYPALSLRYIFNLNKSSIHMYDQNF